MRNSWKKDECYARYGVNGSICSFIMYLSEVSPLFEFVTNFSESIISIYVVR